MKTYNKVLLIGNVGNEPIIKQFEKSIVVKLNIATNNFYLSKENEKVIETQWHTIIAWNHLATYIQNNIQKGSLVHVEGKINYRKYTDDNQKTHVVTEIIADQIIQLNK